MYTHKFTYTCVTLLLCVVVTVAMVTGHEFKKPEDHIHNILQDPTGQHLLVCFKSSQECYYITRNAKKPRQLSKMKVWPSSCDVFVHYLNWTIKCFLAVSHCICVVGKFRIN